MRHPQPPPRRQPKPPPPPNHNSLVSFLSKGPLHGVRRAVTFCACHQAFSSFVRFSTACSSCSASSLGGREDLSHWQAPPAAQEQPTLYSDVVELRAASAPRRPKAASEPSAWHMASRDSPKRRARNMFVRWSAPVGDAGVTTVTRSS